MKDKSEVVQQIAQATNTQEQAEFLTRYIEISLKDLHRHRKDNRRKASTIKIATILFSGIVTILLGLQITGLEKYFKDAAFTLGAIVTLLNALEPFFNFRALWVEHEAALADMYRLKNDVDFYLAGTKPNEVKAKKLEQFLERYKEIWNSLNQNYIRFRKGDITSNP